jgi:hypothetical protein
MYSPQVLWQDEPGHGQQQCESDIPSGAYRRGIIYDYWKCTLRLLTRWLLMPIVGFAYLVMNLEIMATSLMITIFVLMLISFAWVLKKTDIPR